MINIQKLINEEKNKGYKGDNASAKVCQDLVLKALANGPLNRNVTIKGGVVMRSKTGNIRRATQDLDIDFIRYSLVDEAIDLFISKLNCIEGITFTRYGKIEELKIFLICIISRIMFKWISYISLSIPTYLMIQR